MKKKIAITTTRTKKKVSQRNSALVGWLEGGEQHYINLDEEFDRETRERGEKVKTKKATRI